MIKPFGKITGRPPKIGQPMPRVRPLSSFDKKKTHSGSIIWETPNLEEEEGEYFENPHTQRKFLERGLSFNTPASLRAFMESRGVMILFTRDLLAKRADNLTLDPGEFQIELEDSEYAESYLKMEKKLRRGLIRLPAPIVFDFGDVYYGFSGNRRMNLAFNNGFESLVIFRVNAREFKREQETKI